MSIRWANALRNAGAPNSLLQSWHALRAAITTHQRLLTEYGIGKEVSERDRVRVNARRVGLEAPPFADEAEASFSDILNNAFERRGQATQGKCKVRQSTTAAANVSSQ